MIGRDRLRKAMIYEPVSGQFFWIAPPPEHAELRGREAGAPRKGNHKYYWVIKIGGKAYRRSWLAYLWMTGDWPADQIDHVNGNSLDDRWENLRAATATENAQNHKRRAKKSPLPMGVREVPSGRFAARIAVNKQKIHLGTFDTPESASRAYQTARREHFGEFS